MPRRTVSRSSSASRFFRLPFAFVASADRLAPQTPTSFSPDGIFCSRSSKLHLSHPALHTLTHTLTACSSVSHVSPQFSQFSPVPTVSDTRPSPATGSAGLINTISMLSQGHIAAGVLGVITSVGWAFQTFAGGWLYKTVGVTAPSEAGRN